MVGVRTSYHAALAGEWMLRWAGVDARAVMSPDFADYADSYPVGPDDGVVVLAHSGTKSSTSRALARALGAGALVVSVGSRTAEHRGSPLVLRHWRLSSRTPLVAALGDVTSPEWKRAQVVTRQPTGRTCRDCRSGSGA